MTQKIRNATSIIAGYFAGNINVTQLHLPLLPNLVPLIKRYDCSFIYWKFTVLFKVHDSIYFVTQKAIKTGQDSIHCITITRYLETYYFKQLHAIYLTILLSANLRKFPGSPGRSLEIEVSLQVLSPTRFLLYITIDPRFLIKPELSSILA